MINWTHYFTSPLVKFILVGSVGFFCDGGLLTLLSQKLEIGVYLSRLFSFSFATLITWLLNRTWVFGIAANAMRSKHKEYLHYLSIQVGGALLNLGVFSLLIAVYPSLKQMPIVPLAIGAMFGLAFNYCSARFWVFRSTAY
jgi:putative flippase GtrA